MNIISLHTEWGFLTTKERKTNAINKIKKSKLKTDYFILNLQLSKSQGVLTKDDQIFIKIKNFWNICDNKIK